MKHITTVIVGAGQCGLAMSRCLTQRSVDHVIFERGEVANSWRTERWDSLRLLTPNWQSSLPGDAYQGTDPHGFMTMDELIGRLARYARYGNAPVQTNTAVLRATPDGRAMDGGYLVETSQGSVHCANLVLASGACNVANVPAIGNEMPRNLHCLTPITYKKPADLPDGGVLVVGASATGVQIARELQASGRQVVLSVGEHVRVPRTYRGRDIKWWMDATGILDQRFDAVDDLARVRRTPSLQLAGYPDRSAVDLNALIDLGVEIVGRLSGLRDGRAMFSGSLTNHCAMADLKMNRLLNAIDEWAAGQIDHPDIAPLERYAPTRVPGHPRLDLNLNSGEIKSVIWATGYRPDYSWLHLPVFDPKGRLRHEGGIVDAPGVYAMGLPFMRRRKSTLIDGAGADAADLADHMFPRTQRRAA